MYGASPVLMSKARLTKSANTRTSSTGVISAQMMPRIVCLYRDWNSRSASTRTRSRDRQRSRRKWPSRIGRRKRNSAGGASATLPEP
jgi:hypothetical protein